MRWTRAFDFGVDVDLGVDVLCFLWVFMLGSHGVDATRPREAPGGLDTCTSFGTTRVREGTVIVRDRVPRFDLGRSRKKCGDQHSGNTGSSCPRLIFGRCSSTPGASRCGPRPYAASSAFSVLGNESEDTDVFLGI